MNPNCNTQAPPHQKIPKDGWGPRGRPDCYYTSRVLNSTAGYVRFVKKLRALEEEERIGLEDKKKNNNDNNFLSFFNRCDRKALINKVEHRVKLSLDSYEEDLKEKRKRLAKFLSEEEKFNVSLFVKQAQSGTELLWQEKMDRLAYLLAKRQKEAEEKFSDIPLDKCTHLHPCLVAMRKRECQDIIKYQIREKQMRKEAEREMEKMWHDLAMKEADALAARMEYDTIDRLRRDKEANEYTQFQIRQAHQKRAEERERLRKEALAMKADTEAYYKQLEEEKRNREEKARASDKEKRAMVREHQESIAKRNEQDKLMEDTWDSIAQCGAAEELAKEERRKQKERDLDECNFMMAAMKNRIAALKGDNEELILQEGQKIQDAKDLKRCQYKKWTQNLTKENSAFNKRTYEKQMKDKEERVEEAEQDEYERQLKEQLDALVKHKELTDAQARKLHQKDLLKQIEYTKLLKERAQQEEIQERKKCLIAQREYHKEMEKMLCRQFFSNEVHPFLKKMSSGCLKIDICPCSQPTYCEDPTKLRRPEKQ